MTNKGRGSDIQEGLRILRVGILGYGYMGQIRHLALEKVEEFEVVGIYDPDESALARFPGLPSFKSGDELLHHRDIDVVFVCVPNYLAKGYVISALESGKHVFCEKPPGLSSREVREIGEASRKHPELKVKFGFNHRYASSVSKLFEVTASGELGDILWVRGAYGKGPDGRQGRDSWRSYKRYSGGGILIDQGIHMLDICLTLCGPFEEVKSMLGKQFWEQESEDIALVLLRNKRGQMVQIHSSSTQWKHLFRLEVSYEKGYVTINGLVTKSGSYGPETIAIAKNHGTQSANTVGRPEEEVITFDENPSWDRELKEFSDSILRDAPVRVGTIQDAENVMALVELIYERDCTSPLGDTGWNS